MAGLVAGCLLGAQPSANGYLGRHVGHPIQAATISFVSGTALLLLVSVFMGQFPPKLTISFDQIPWWAWIGGAIGTVLVTTSLYFVPHVGSLYWFSAVITGQIFAALLLDQFGWMGNPKQPANLLRICGAMLLVAGILCITYSRTTGLPKSGILQKHGEGADTESSPATKSELTR